MCLNDVNKRVRRTEKGLNEIKHMVVDLAEVGGELPAPTAHRTPIAAHHYLPTTPSDAQDSPPLPSTTFTLHPAPCTLHSALCTLTLGYEAQEQRAHEAPGESQRGRGRGAIWHADC